MSNSDGPGGDESANEARSVLGWVEEVSEQSAGLSGDEPIGDEPVGDERIEDGPSGVLFDGDQGTLPLQARRAAVLLLKRTHLTSITHPKQWRALLDHANDIGPLLNNLFLELVIDERNEVAYKRQAGREVPGRPFTTLLKERKYTPEEAAVMIRLRQIHQAARREGHSAAYINRSDLFTDLEYLRPDSSDLVRDRVAVDRAIQALVADDLLLKVSDDDDRLRISPVIETILKVERVQAFADAAFGGRDEPEMTGDDTADEADTDAGEQALGLDWGKEAHA